MTTSHARPSARGAPGSSEDADLVVVANRLPVDLVTDPDGTEHWRSSPGGLVTALAPTLAEQGGAWVGWAGTADEEREPFDHEGMHLHPVALSADEVAEYYEGFANATLWPLYHDVVVTPVFDRPEWWRAYERVNARFADAAAGVAGQGATVWVQDYQLQLVPAMLRARRPDLRIGFFLHIPFPPPELFEQLPQRRAVLDGLLGADLVGTHVPGGAENLRRAARRMAGAEVDDAPVGVRRDLGTIDVDGRAVRVGAFPISIDAATVDARGRDTRTAERAAELRAELGEPRTVLLGVDRLDYTKGIDVRLRAVGALLADGRLDPATTVLVQVATPSRERVQAYQDTREDVEHAVGRLNGEHAAVGHPVVHYLHRSLAPDELAALYRAADLLLVTPVRDGMNLVAKEYVAARTDGGGALVLSEFTGAAEELDGAHLVNPHDLAGVERAIVDALATGEAEARERMARLRAQVAEHDVALWARSFLEALASC